MEREDLIHRQIAVLFLFCLVTLGLGACAALGIPTPTSNAQRVEYARGSLNGVYDSVVILREGCKPVTPSCRLSDTDKGRVMAIANAVDAELKLIEGGNNDVNICLATVNEGLVKAGKPPIVQASSCLTLALQVLTALRATIGSL